MSVDMTVEPAPEPPDTTNVVVVNAPPPAAPPEAPVAAPHEHAEHGELRALCESLRADLESLRASMAAPPVAEPPTTEIVNPPAPEPVAEPTADAFGAGVIF